MSDEITFEETAGDPESAKDLPVTAGRDVTTNTPDSVVEEPKPAKKTAAKKTTAKKG